MTPPPPDAGPFSAARRSLTIGILLGVTLVGFETLAVVTIAPVIAGSFDAVERYGWIFSSFLLATLLGAVVAGHALDRWRPGGTLLVALGLFGTGLLAAGLTPSMNGVLVARALQGLGGGALVTSLYVAVTRAYPDRSRPRVMALMSSAWILPALLGPTVAGALATAFGWRVVFLGLLPVVLLVSLLTLPAFRTLERGAASEGFGGRFRSALLLVTGTLLLLLGLEAEPGWAWIAIPLGAGAAVVGLRPLLPRGTLRLRRGLAAAVGARGSIYPAFVTAETLVSLMLVTHYGFSPAVAGAILAVGSLSWTGGAWLQERLDARNGPEARGSRIAVGAGMVTLGLAVQLLGLVLPGQVLLVVAVGWSVAGAGIGLAHATSSVHVFALAGADGAGTASASLQVVDHFGAALGTGIAGAVFATFLGTRLGAPAGIAVALAMATALAFTGVIGGLRSRVVRVAYDAPERTHV